MWQLIILQYKHCRDEIQNLRNITCRLNVTRPAPLVEQELPILPEHMSLPPVISVDQSVLFCVVFCRSLFHFLLVIVLSVFLLFTVTDYLLIGVFSY